MANRVLSYRQYYNMCGDEFQDGDIIEIHAVVWLDYANTFRFYIDPEGDWDPEEVARHGDSIGLGKEAGKALCPTATYGRHYR